MRIKLFGPSYRRTERIHREKRDKRTVYRGGARFKGITEPRPKTGKNVAPSKNGGKSQELSRENLQTIRRARGEKRRGQKVGGGAMQRKEDRKVLFLQKSRKKGKKGCTGCAPPQI